MLLYRDCGDGRLEIPEASVQSDDQGGGTNPEMLSSLEKASGVRQPWSHMDHTSEDY